MKFIPIGLIGLFALSGCATTVVPPPELVEARSAFNRANNGAATRLAMVDLHTARERLNQAEQSFQASPDSDQTRHDSYVALRSAQTAEARGDTAQAELDHTNADAARGQLTGQRLTETQDALHRSQEQGSQTAVALGAEHQARLDAERQAQVALTSLREVASVREESRGMVITLSGSVLFATGQSALLPIAQQRLDQVAQALHDQGPRHLRVEGFSDSRGSAGANLSLSQARALSVLNYLVSRGISSSMIESAGVGAERPVADNTTAEGRANNRRVEIVVSPAAAPAPTPVAMRTPMH